jgi:cyclophilin family peptidyl-prolyl cis-trans isomerase
MKLLTLAVLMSASLGAAANPQVLLTTSRGNITLELYEDQAPKSVENFLAYARSGHYQSTIFHRVIPGFMIQGGGLTKSLDLKSTREAIENEADNGLSNRRGTVAMARKADPHSATSQFFINVGNNYRLDHVSDASGSTWGYAVFGEVIDGMDVVDAIAQVETTARSGHENVPKEPIVIENVEIVTQD